MSTFFLCIIKIYILCILGLGSKRKCNLIWFVSQPDELSFEEGELLYVMDSSSDPNWLKAKCGTCVGLVPCNYGIFNKILQFETAKSEHFLWLSFLKLKKMPN